MVSMPGVPGGGDLVIPRRPAHEWASDACLLAGACCVVGAVAILAGWWALLVGGLMLVGAGLALK